MKAIVFGAGGKIGKRLVKALEAKGIEVKPVLREDCELRNISVDLRMRLGEADVVYLCAAMTRFIDCEADSDAYSVNVDAPLEIARQYAGAKIVYLSSEAVERAIGTKYGLMKALAEISLRAISRPVIARLSKVDDWSLDDACDFLVTLATAQSGIYRWKANVHD
jgi:dTDP-4-dehydrorhamnose reductase